MPAQIKAVLFDADGVLTVPGELFSYIYEREQGLRPGTLQPFFKDKFPTAMMGKADLKELIADNQDIWQWDAPIDDLLQAWFETEDVKNEPLIEAVKELKQANVPVFLATNQEKYRGEFMKNVMFKDLFDHYFISSDIGFTKPDSEYFEAVIAKISSLQPDVKPENIIFFDDTISHTESAKNTGLNAHRYESPEQVLTLLKPLLA